MDMDALKEAIDQGFEDLKSGLAKQFGEVQKQFHERINKTDLKIEHLRHDLKIFDEDSEPGSVIPLARRVTKLEGRVKRLENKRRRRPS